MSAEAEKDHQRALELRPDLPGLRLELGQIYQAQSDWPKAESEFGRKPKPDQETLKQRIVSATYSCRKAS